MKLPLSVFLITHNEEARLAKTLGALQGWVADIVVVDSGSTDATIQIAEAYGARVFHRDWTGYGAQKRFAEDQCVQEWCFNIDADEVVTPQLKDELMALFGNGAPAPAAYKTHIPYVYPGDETPRAQQSDYNVVRLYHKSVGRYRDHPVYDRVELVDAAEIKQLKAPLAHYAILNWSQMIDKANNSSSHNLEKLLAKPHWQLKLRIVFGFPLNFVRNYFFRGHIWGGHKGYVFALNTAYTRTLRIAKALELKHQASKTKEK